ncbi:MAG: putative glycosyltransferase, partial [Dehalococcoidia bacterium]|nr:putative glycosyltransferase [Dehalococcoidia bacterium]
SLGIGQRVTFQGAVSSHQMPQELARLDTLVLPSLTRSRWKEQFGRVLVEAMACGVPVVGSDSGEIPNVIGPAGMVFPEGNAGALRERLAQLMADPEMRKDLSQRGRERVEALYTQKQVAESTYEMYLRILDGELERTSPPW